PYGGSRAVRVRGGARRAGCLPDGSPGAPACHRFRPTVRTGSTGTPVQLYDCNGSGAQQWRPRADGSLYNPMSGRCLDGYAYSTTNGSPVLIWDCNGAANQVWHVPA
ncbi:ricin-type beta-trefoil lectin domain protein, partial [Kitasatospora sp. NPDC057500]|uniref:ricin-type beta-trefoil lectin domain protein n=1 Tax=Kitasatospora sp. NPDC057500 TaxID=3346151 RepID=UPI00367B616D